jgi:hypothetical protein
MPGDELVRLSQRALDNTAFAFARHHLHHRLHFFTQIDIGHAKNCSIHDQRMLDKKIFTFLRLNIHAAGNDHEGLAVGQMDKAVFMDILGR